MRLDRRVVLGSLALAALAIIGVVAATRHSRSEAGTLAAFLRLADARERTTWMVDFHFERTLTSGAHFSQAIVEANRPPVHVLSSGGSVTVDFGDRIAQCQPTPKGARCHETKSAPDLEPAAVYRVATGAGGYTVHRSAERTILGERATCFALVAKKGHVSATLGNETVQCYASDGVPLRSELHRAGALDVREAVTVTRRVTNAQLDALLQEAEASATAAGN